MSTPNPTLHALCEKLGQSLESFQVLGGGKNSRVFEVKTTNGNLFVAKLYYQNTSDKRNRLDTEVSALRFLWDHGIRVVPELLTWIENPACAAFTRIDGDVWDRSSLKISDLEQAIEFIRLLYQLSILPEAQQLPIASEATFSVNDLCEVIDFRLLKLRKVPPSAEVLMQEFHQFVTQELLPAYEEIKKKALHFEYPKSISFVSNLQRDLRILSPSDFGFHNALRRTDGTWIFHDFEYFGWDDPAKLLSDFVLHPAMKLDQSLAEYFVKNVKHVFQNDAHLELRFSVVFPLYMIKWVCIILNEFVPEYRARRGFSDSELDQRLSKVLEEQLTKAKIMLKKGGSTICS